MSQEFLEAVKQGNQEEVERRLKLDPTLLQIKEDDLSPVMLAAYYQHPALASFLADKSLSLTIFEASATGKFNHVMRMLAREPKLVNAYAEDGFQPLGLACFFGHYEVVEYLVKAGASVNAHSQNDLKVTPLQSAVAARHSKIVALLLEHGADPNVRQEGGFTPLHAAAQNGDADIIRILLFGGAILNSKNDEGKTPFDLAAEAGNTKAKTLLGEGITRRFRVRRDPS